MNDRELLIHLHKQAENITPPDSLSPTELEKKIEFVHQKRYFFRQPRFMRIAAACLVLLLIGGGFGWHILSSPQKDAPVVVTNQEDTGVTYSQLCNLINYHFESSTYGSSELEDSTTSSSEGASTSSGKQTSSFSEADAQVDGVTEGDLVKSDGTYLYTLRNNTTGFILSIYEAAGKNTEKISSIRVTNEDYKEMYLINQKLMIITEKWQDVQADSYGTAMTGIIVYNVSDPLNPKKERELSQSGQFSTSRLTDGYLYTFSQYYVTEDNNKEDKPETYIPKANDELISSDSIRMMGDLDSNSYMVMTSLNVSNADSFTDQKAVFGNNSAYYMTTSHLYLASTISFAPTSKTAIAKYDFLKGKFDFKTLTQVRGQITNSYYMHEYNGNFCFVYGSYDENTNKSTNGLCVLDENLNLLGEINDLGVNEEIYASYYIENMAYFVTYRNTDPVFAVDISNPKKPVLKSKLKLPGFSSYLHSFGSNHLLGIGSGTRESGGMACVKLSMFSIHKNNKLKETAKTLIGLDTTSYAGDNHKSVYIDESKKLIGLAIEGYESTEKYNYYDVFQFKNGKFKKILSQSIDAPETARGIQIGNYFYIVDGGKHISVYNMETWKKEGAVRK